jgi:hypothetical protein
VGGVPGKVVIRIPFDDFARQVMFHCHTAATWDDGMMRYINILPWWSVMERAAWF